MSLVPSALVALALSSFAPASRPSVDTYLGLQSLGEAGFSADGRFAVMQVQAPARAANAFDDERLLDAQLSRIHIWALPRGAAPQPRLPLAAEPGPFSPDATRMAVTRPRGHQLQLGILALASGAVRWLNIFVEPAGLGRSMQWRSSTELVVLSPAPRTPPQLMQTGYVAEKRLRRLWSRQRQGRTPSVTEPYRTDAYSDGPRRLRIVTGSSSVRTLARGAFADFQISPDGRSVALLERAEPRALRTAAALTVSEHLRRTALALFTFADGRLHSACAGDAMPTLLSWAPDSHAVLVATRETSDFDWKSGRLQLAAPNGACATLSTGGARPDIDIDDEEGLPVLKAGWSGRSVVARLRSPHQAPRWTKLAIDQPPVTSAPPPQVASSPFGEAARVALAQPSATDIGGGQENDNCLAVQGAARICAQTTAQGVTEVGLDTASGSYRLLQLNRQLKRLRWARVSPLLQGPSRHWLYLPADAPARPPPLVVLPYPGASAERAPARYAPGSSSLITQAQLLAAHGFAVLVPSLPPAAPGRADRGVAEAILAAVQTAAASGQVDACRIALWGHSFGGYAALVTAEASQRFVAIVAQNAPTDLLSFRGALPPAPRVYADSERYLEFDYGWSEAGQGGFEAPPFRALHPYLEASVTSHVERLNTPVLLINGDQDFVGLGQAEELAAALRRRDHPAQLLTFWGEGHTLLSPANHRELYLRVLHFLDAAFARSPSACLAGRAAEARTQPSGAQPAHLAAVH